MPGFRRRGRFYTDHRGDLPVLLPLLVAAVLCVGFFWLMSSRLRPLVETAAVSRATNLISAQISRAVDDCLSEESMEYSDFITVDTDGNGAVLSLTGRPAESSRFKRLVIERIISGLDSVSPEELDIPIGSLSGSVLLSGIGPGIRVRVHSVGEVTAVYSSSFAAAGVNQTHHGVYLDISATVHLLIPGEIVPVTVTDRVCVAETIILGDVPDTYIHLEKGE